ncbi:MAG: hypothetical protein JWN25_716 [Verrucomicrobiales bacterium]|nr:hypothetical protein [Verrucomicrobiales bacterium]
MEYKHAKKILTIHSALAALVFVPLVGYSADTEKPAETPKVLPRRQIPFDINKFQGARRPTESITDGFMKSDPFAGPEIAPARVAAPLSKDAMEKAANDREWIFVNPNEPVKEKTFEQQLGISKYDPKSSGNEQKSNLEKFLSEGTRRQGASANLQSESAKSFLYGSSNEKDERNKEGGGKSETDNPSINPNLKMDTFMSPASNASQDTFGKKNVGPVFGQNSAMTETSRQKELEKRQERLQKFDAIYENPAKQNDLVKSSGLLDPISKLKDTSRDSANPTVPGYDAQGVYSDPLTAFRPQSGAGSMLGDITSRSLGIAPRNSGDLDSERHIKPTYHPGVLPFPKRPGSYTPNLGERRP